MAIYQPPTDAIGDQDDAEGDTSGNLGGGDVDADDNDSLADALFALYQKEFLGDCDDSMLDEFEEDLKKDEQYTTVSEMDDINTKFIGAVIEQTRDSEHSGIGISTSTGVRIDEEQDSDNDMESCRPFEDEPGEKLLQTFLRKRLDPEHAEHTHRDHQPSKPRVVPVALTSFQTDSALQTWKQSVQKSMESCVDMAERLHKFDAGRFDRTIALEASLLMHNKADKTVTDCSYISWLKPYKTLNGRVLTLDEEFGIVYPSHFNVTKLCFSGCIMIVPCVGARVRKQNRETIPANVRRLQRMFSVSISGGLADDTLLLDLNDPDTEIGDGNVLCVACRKGGSMGIVKQCMFCLQWWHSHCNDQVAHCTYGFRQTHGIPSLAEHELTLLDLPFTLMCGSQPSSGYVESNSFNVRWCQCGVFVERNCICE